MKKAMVADQQGKIWLVYKGDSAWNQCRSLSRAGVADIVLPRETLLHGTLPSPDSISIPEASLKFVLKSADVQASVRRQIRLKDCVQWLAYNHCATWL